MENAILNYFIGHVHPLIIEQHFDASGSNSVMRRKAIPFVAAAVLSEGILKSAIDIVALGICGGKN
jgi:hypothetical protein